MAVQIRILEQGSGRYLVLHNSPNQADTPLILGGESGMQPDSLTELNDVDKCDQLSLSLETRKQEI